MTSISETLTLCIGIDIAWFGGSARNRDSQYDCIVALSLPGSPETTRPCDLSAARIRLIDRDPEATQLLEGISDLLRGLPQGGKVILALDAPLQAMPRAHLPPRNALPARGSVERRACENYLSAECQRIDAAAGGAAGWHPNIQPGAPLAPRVEHVLRGLHTLGFTPWTFADQDVPKLMIECFPAEAIWAAKRMGYYGQTMLPTDVKAYKKQARKRLSPESAGKLLHDALDAFAIPTGEPTLWMRAVNDALTWLLADAAWKEGTLYRGGKLLDDTVDSMICLATALSYFKKQHHTWHDRDQIDDGHIIGPGLLTGIIGYQSSTDAAT